MYKRQGHIRPAGHSLSHNGALGAVAVSAAAKDGDNTLEPGFTQSLEHVLKRIGGMGVVHKDAEALGVVHPCLLYTS